MSEELDVKLFIMSDGTTIIGNVLSESLSNSNVLTVDNPAYLVMQEKGFQILPLLDTVGVWHGDTKIDIDLTKDLRYGNYAREPDEGLVKGYKQTFGYSVIEIPEQSIIL